MDYIKLDKAITAKGMRRTRLLRMIRDGKIRLCLADIERHEAELTKPNPGRHGAPRDPTTGRFLK